MRLRKLRQKMAEAELDGLLIIQAHNRRYLSGFTGSSGVLIISSTRQALATDSRYYELVRQQCPDWELIEVGYDFAGNMLENLRQMGLAGRRVGFEAGHLDVATLLQWERALEGRVVLVQTKDIVEQLRMIKEDGEIDIIRRAVALADETLTHITDWIQPGTTESQVAWELESYMRTHGASALSFEPVVASGPNAAKPHARATERVIQAGEPITMDFGCVVDGYCSDLTRTICLGQPADEQYLAVWHTVLGAQQAAISGAKANMTGEAVDKLARDLIDQAGYGEYFGHGLGHSLGLAVHESPRYSYTYSEPVPAGVVMTIEPGIYIPGWGGVRIEDVVLVRENGVEILSSALKKPVLE